MKAWHGSAHLHNNFSMEEIQTGEGALAFGWGLYFAEEPDVARSYRDSLAGSDKPGCLYEVELAIDEVDLLNWDKPIAKQSEKVQKAIQKAIEGHADQVQKDMMEYFAVTHRAKCVGGSFYRTLTDMFGNGLTTDGREEASRFLLSIGIPGIQYLDAFSRKGAGFRPPEALIGRKTRNFVIFDESLVEIRGRYQENEIPGEQEEDSGFRPR